MRFQFEFYGIPMCMKAKTQKKLFKSIENRQDELFRQLLWGLN